MDLHNLWVIARCALVVFVAGSVLLFRYLEIFHKIDHRTIYNAEYKHDELDSYTYFRAMPSDFHSTLNEPKRDDKLANGNTTLRSWLFNALPRF
jgi:hypothetical protein